MGSHNSCVSFSCAKAANYCLSPPVLINFSAANNNLVGSNWGRVGRKLECSRLITSGIRTRDQMSSTSSYSESTTTSTDDDDDGFAAARWLLQPIGDGDSRHIGYKVARPGAFEIASDVVTVGRVPEKADLVIPVPTVSGLHARIQNTQDNLLITDLDSTNGTFIDEKRLQPGIVYGASPGNLITFGDTNLAIFRVYKLDKQEEYSNQNSGADPIQAKPAT